MSHKRVCPFDEIPKWTIENQVLSVEPEVNHLGVKISNKSNKSLESEALFLNHNDEKNQKSRESDGLGDSLRFMFRNYHNENHILTAQLLKAF